MSIMLRWREKFYQDTVASIFRRNVEMHPNKTAFMMDDKKITFQEVKIILNNFIRSLIFVASMKVEDLSNKVGNYFKSNGYQKGETVALLMETRLEYPSMWLGLSKIGVITALINFNLRNETLIHSIKAASTKAIIVSAEMMESLEEIMGDEEISKLSIYVYDTENDDVKKLNSKTLNLHRDLKYASKSPMDIKSTLPKDKLFYIYTSGTTGMPKAAVITNLRFQFMSSGCAMMYGLGRDEVVYNVLPLYHTGWL